MIKVGIVVFPNVEEMDFIGPFEVLSYANKIDETVLDIRLLAETAGPVNAFNGLRFLPDQTIENAKKEQFDVIVVPGGKGRYEAMKNLSILSFVKEQALQAKFMTSVCTGAFILAEAGLLKGKKATTYHTTLPELQGYEGVTAMPQKVVQDGTVITAAGVTSGMELGFYLLQTLLGRTLAEKVADGIEYTVNWAELVQK